MVDACYTLGFLDVGLQLLGESYDALQLTKKS